MLFDFLGLIIKDGRKERGDDLISCFAIYFPEISVQFIIWPFIHCLVFSIYIVTLFLLGFQGCFVVNAVLLEILFELTRHFVVINFFIFYLLFLLLMAATSAVLTIVSTSIIVLSFSLSIAICVLSTLRLILLFTLGCCSVAITLSVATTTIILVIIVSATVPIASTFVSLLLLFKMLILNFFLDLTLRLGTFIYILCFKPAWILVTEHIFDEQLHSLANNIIIFSLDKYIKSIEDLTKIFFLIVLLSITCVFHILLESLSNFVHQVDGTFNHKIISCIICITDT